MIVNPFTQNWLKAGVERFLLVPPAAYYSGYGQLSDTPTDQHGDDRENRRMVFKNMMHHGHRQDGNAQNEEPEREREKLACSLNP